MINIVEKSKCSGCGACSQVCKNSCIKMIAEEQGFVYPSVNLKTCTNCKLCEKVCPVINTSAKRIPINTVAAINLNEKERLTSSSGGIFVALAKNILSQGGVVFGALFNEKWEVYHDYVVNKDKLYLLQGSKYVQSMTGNSFVDVLKFLKEGRKVMYSGTPCQISGLNKFLNKKYDNLLLVEVVCHGVPSPLVWQEYLKTINPQSINFRDKRLGWKNFSLSISKDDYEPHNENLFMRGFLSNLTLRPSCFACNQKAGSSGCDLSIADFWGVNTVYPEIDDDKGVSLVLIYTNKGRDHIQSIPIFSYESDYNLVVKLNTTIENNVIKPKEYNNFWRLFAGEGLIAIEKSLKKMRPNIIMKLHRSIKFKIKFYFNKLISIH